MSNMGRCGQHGCAFSVRLVVNGQRDEYCPECEIDRLRAALATAEAERDAARQEAAAVQAAHDATAQRYNMAIDRLHAEQDTMSRDGSSLRASLARLQQEREWLIAPCMCCREVTQPCQHGCRCSVAPTETQE